MAANDVANNIGKEQVCKSSLEDYLEFSLFSSVKWIDFLLLAMAIVP